MTVPKLIDDINRLFEQMVRDPWSRAQKSSVAAPARGETHVDVDMPVAGGQLGDVAVSLEGRRLVVRARRRSARGGGAEGAATQEVVEREFTLPAAVEVSAIEARLEGEMLRVRVRLQPERS
jgi:HSP20 family molecular chaperone IbpA